MNISKNSIRTSLRGRYDRSNLIKMSRLLHYVRNDDVVYRGANIKLKPCITFIFFLISFNLFSQTDYSWWGKVHNWDGITSWYNYLKFSPGYFGPNALPVPEITKGFVMDKGSIELAVDGHFSKGDNTQNLFTKLYYPIVANLIAIESYVVPIEHFKMDTATRDDRAARIKSGEGTAGGDIYFGTIIQLVKNKKFPDIAIRLSCRTASGTNVSAARYTDAPGYFFDLSGGKDFKIKNSENKKIRVYGMLGFYSWQTNSEAHRQDDALLYGAGIDFSCEKYTISASSAGYIGYINNHDSPAVVRLNILRKGKSFNYGISTQYGLHDFYYKSIRLSLIYNLAEKLMLKK